MIKKAVFIILFLLLIHQSFFSTTSKSFVTYPKVDFSMEEIKSKNFDTIYLGVASPTSEHIGSVGAHTFVLLAHGEDISNAVAINFYAYHESLGALEKIAKGASYGLEGYIDVRELSYLSERYTVGQNRTLIVYKTNIDKKYVSPLIEEFYKYKESNILYQFFFYNCASLVGDVFSTVLSSDEKQYDFPKLIMPSRLMHLFDKYDLLIDKKTISPPLIKHLYDESYLSKSEIITRS